MVDVLIVLVYFKTLDNVRGFLTSWNAVSF